MSQAPKMFSKLYLNKQKRLTQSYQKVKNKQTKMVDSMFTKSKKQTKTCNLIKIILASLQFKTYNMRLRMLQVPKMFYST